MNNSGLAVKTLVENHQVPINDLMIIHDDLDLDVGRIKIVSNGGPGGHRGVESVIHHLGSYDFTRIKIGIGRPQYNEIIEDFVLSPFYSDEEKIVKEVLNVVIQAVEVIVLNGVEVAMNKFNCIIMKREGE